MRAFITLAMLLGAAAATKSTTTVSVEKKVDGILEDIVDTVKKVEKFDEKVHTMDSKLTKKEKSFDAAAKKQPLLLFKALPQRACPWSKFKKGTDWSFASMKSDNKEECARACIAAEGCTGFEVGPHTSKAYDYISYCALWFNKKCNDEKSMLHLSPKGYVATTYVMVKTVTVDSKIEEKTPFGTIEVEEKKTFHPSESKEHYNPTAKKHEKPVSKKSTEKSIKKELKAKEAVEVVSTTSSVSRFEEFPQLACDFSQYTEGTDWKYTKTTSDDVESCATACLNADDCTGFEIGIESVRGPYCALWKAGACSTKKSMTAIPVTLQTVSTFVLADYHSKHVDVDGFAIVFLVACACAMVISVLLVGCICYRVCRRVCCRRVEVDTNTDQSVVAGELVQAKVVRGTPVGQHVDVVVVRGEAVDQN